ncbi:monovalent cation/H+ antiporter complex subunit F [Nocardioides sp.]|uniref:monovalent cation/H+ antiporter complex subunit F n=1 Tax=Nocardioides sp. TaxID=35761 RepID=UPI002734FED5|nr:monovalent cation/H+ antiporter complex subunit F [Nocardioides sp.]MDP3893457.1 monovalent cation/H+ antiporter complex subunit F [Nocardioides sp.]
MTIVLGVCLGILALSASLVVVRMTLGPTVLDRAIALDVVVAIVICAIAVEAALHQHTTTLPVLLVLTLVGFVGSVSVARFTRGRTDVEGEPS